MAKETILFTTPKLRLLATVLGVLITAVLITAAMPLYLPFSQTDSIGIPIILFPIIWLTLLYFSLLQRKVILVWLTLITLSLIHAWLIYQSLS